jgi:hypothetical protein
MGSAWNRRCQALLVSTLVMATRLIPMWWAKNAPTTAYSFSGLGRV